MIARLGDSRRTGPSIQRLYERVIAGYVMANAAIVMSFTARDMAGSAELLHLYKTNKAADNLVVEAWIRLLDNDFKPALIYRGEV